MADRFRNTRAGAVNIPGVGEIGPGDCVMLSKTHRGLHGVKTMISLGYLVEATGPNPTPKTAPKQKPAGKPTKGAGQGPSATKGRG